MTDLLKLVSVAFGTVFMILLIGIPISLFNGWALWMLWGWFAVPLGIPGISLIHATGLGTLLGLIANQYIPLKDGDSANRWAFIILQPLVAVGLGYVIHLFM